MSDTDDTDLLLLIPPDFFLVPSDLEDFDSDFDVGYDSKVVKDTIVSDLLTQVNDLESRVCQIESLERTSTRCSTCHDDSFINQSIVSLTESDVLRAHIKEKGYSNKGFIDSSLMVKSQVNDIPVGVTCDRDDCTSELFAKDTDGNVTKTAIYDDGCTNSFLDPGYEQKKNHEESRPICLGSQISREKQTRLLDEVDSYLMNKQSNALENRGYLENCEQNTTQSYLEQDKIFTRNDTEINQSNSLPQNYNNHDIDNEDHQQSLALTEVYKLISQMEETQTVMQKRLSASGSKYPLKFQDKNDDNTEISRHLKSFGQVLNLDDLTSQSPKPLYGGERNTNSEKVDDYTLNKTAEANYALTQINLSTESKPNQATSKSLSPSRVSAKSYDPIDVVRANVPEKQDVRNNQFGDERYSPRKSVGFRRQLQFDKALSPLRASKSRTSIPGEPKTLSLNDNQNKIENYRSVPVFRNSRPFKTNHSLEEKFKSLNVQRGSGTNSRESPSMQHYFINKPASDTLQQKISSNNLLSLSELWNKEPTFYSDDPNKLRQKLEEERYRRQHCEQQIQTLQVRVLEEQEKLAVAVKVDQEKDRAIMQITESWRKLNDHWGELEEQRHSLAQQLHAEREAAKSRSEELSRKVERWEKEVSQALDLAAGYKEKCESIQKQMEALKRDTDEKIQEKENQLHNMTEENVKIIEENKGLSEQLKLLQQQLTEEEDLLSKLKAEVEKSRKRLDEFEAENCVLKEQKVSLTTSIKEERNRVSILEQKLNSLQQALNEAHKKERTAAEETRRSQERVEVARTELRALYQGQLEAVVKEKLQEFQAQLEAAEAVLRAELQAKERQWAEKANEQCCKLTEKYKRDLLRVEQIHKGDLESWKGKLMESERTRAALEKRLQEEAERRADIAQRLHSVMETQWREALNIISNPVKALYEMPKEDNPNRWTHPAQREPGPERMSRSNSCTSLRAEEEAPFSQEGLVTYRNTQTDKDLQLKKYIQMLLERGPGNPVPQTQDSLEQQALPAGNTDLLDRWIQENEKKTAAQTDGQNQFNKPPWR